jgi:hypothetical protein
MPANDFETDTPAQADLTAWAEDHTGLDHVENSTAVVNLYDNHEWIYNETGSEWIDNGLTAVSTATNASLGVVKGSAADGGVSVGSDGAMTINGVPADKLPDIPASKLPDIPADKLPAGMAKFFIGELTHLLVIRPGFVWANGPTLQNVSDNYPLLKAWLLDTGPYGGAAFRKTLTEWNAEWNDAKWNAPDSAGARAGMSPFYVLDESADTIKVSDLRGAYQAAAGFNGQTSGQTLRDAIRNITGTMDTRNNTGLMITGTQAGVVTGAFYKTAQKPNTFTTTGVAANDLGIDTSLVVPTDIVNHPRSIAGYLCLYAGAPA